VFFIILFLTIDMDVEKKPKETNEPNKQIGMARFV